MRTHARLRPAALFAAVALCLVSVGAVGCGGGNGTYNPNLVGTGAPTPGFTLAVNPPSASVVAGTPATYTVTLTAVNGFASEVTPGVTGLPAGATAAFSPTTVTPTATGATTTLTVTTTAATPATTATLTVAAGSGDRKKQGVATLIITAPVTSPDPGSLQGSIE